ncbi:MAG: excinuclease ABC subunit UvrA [Acholeplasmataceae bacterium]
MSIDNIKIIGARENNLKDISLDIPKNKLIVMTGVSGSGKSSLAFDTIYQEGQRRYMESLSSYARQFLGNYEKPDVDSIEGLSPSISIDQKTTSNNPRSTVGTVTEIYDYFRLLYARIGIPYCPGSDTPVTKQTIDEMTNRVLELKEGRRVIITAPVVKRQKGTHKEKLKDWLKNGFTRVIVNEETHLIEELESLDKNKFHDIDLVIDRIVVKDDIRSRVYDALELAAMYANGKTKVIVDDKETLNFSQNYYCEGTDFTIPELEPRLFSFNTPIGACPYCNGLGLKLEVAKQLVINPEKGILDGGIIPFRYADEGNLNLQEIETVCKYYKIDPYIPIRELKTEEIDMILYGSKDKIKFNLLSNSGRAHVKHEFYEGIIPQLNRRYLETSSEWIRSWIESFMIETTCPVCKGYRLNEAALSVRVDNQNISEMMTHSIEDLIKIINNFKLNKEEAQIARLILLELNHRLSFLNDVGLNYLNLARSASTLSGGEAQRIRLATQIGSKLSGVLYVLDEPSIGLHQKDNEKLINSLKKMRDLGNTLIVVEHDHDTIKSADYIVDIGPGAGIDGGYLVFEGTPDELKKAKNSITGDYISGKKYITIPKRRRSGNNLDIAVIGAKEHNLKNITVKFPISKLTLVTGVSGSGKSTLVNEILLKGLRQKIYKSKDLAGLHDMIQDYSLIDKIVEISQSPIGYNPRSNPATYTGVFDDIRDVYALTNEAKMRGYKKGRFSFNVRGGRCEVCRGDGVKRISMHFLPDVYVPCEACGGTRYNKETLQIKYRGKNIADILAMTIDEAVQFFKHHPKILRRLETIKDVGLGYIKLGQNATTLSGGEAQRVKLASELHKRITNKTLYILDEPTTGLHTDDVKRLIKVLHRIVDEGATMIVIEHNLDVIKNADYIIDLGPEGGNKGGYVVGTGTPEELSLNEKSYTGSYLKEILKEGVYE